MVGMAASEADELAGERYLVPPERFVAARDELVRTARAAGNRELAGALHGLPRPTQSAWLVNLLTRHEPDAVQRLRGLGRELRRAQTQLDGAGLGTLSAQRQELVADLLDRARRLAAEAGSQPTDTVLSEVEATLYAALVDLAASSTVLSGQWRTAASGRCRTSTRRRWLSCAPRNPPHHNTNRRNTSRRNPRRPARCRTCGPPRSRPPGPTRGTRPRQRPSPAQ